MIATLARRMLSSAAGNTPTRLTGQVALVTASTAGIGLGIAERLGREGAKVVVCSRKAKNVDETVASLKSMGIDVVGMPAHVGKPEDRTALLATEAVPLMQKNDAGGVSVDKGKIVFISSIASHRMIEDLGVYSISKSALTALGRCLANELAPQDIRVNIVSPGIIATQFSAALLESEEHAATLRRTTPRGRVGAPNGVGNVVGEELFVTGGLGRLRV